MAAWKRNGAFGGLRFFMGRRLAGKRYGFSLRAEGRQGPVPALPVGSIYHAREEQHDVRDEDAEDDDAHGDEDKGQGAVGNVLKGGVGDA